MDIQPSPGVTFGPYTGDAQKWSPPAGLQVDLEPPIATPGGVRVVSVAQNKSSAAIDMVVLGGGVAGSSTNPFAGALRAPRKPSSPSVPPGPEIYPYPSKVSIPAGGSVRYVLDICRSAYDVAPGQTVSVDYSFELWGSARKVGSGSVKLP